MFYFIFKGGWRGTSGVTDLEWHHYTVVAKHGEPNPTFYIDGIIKPVEFSGGNALIDLNYVTSRNLNIGAQLEPGATHYTSNIIDEIRIWNFSMDSLGIVAVMNDTLHPMIYSDSSSGLVGYWRMDKFENLGVNNDGIDDFRDLSFANNNGDSEGNIILTPFVSRVIPDHRKIVESNYYLFQNYPNPFNPSTKITFTLPRPDFVTLEVYNTIGQKVATLLSTKMSSGSHDVEFNASSLPSGIYFYQIHVGDAPWRTGEFSQVKKMVLLR
jgi:hypothetical protein